MITNLLHIQYGSTPLHDASRCGRTDVVKTLISYGGDIHPKDKVSKCFMS